MTDQLTITRPDDWHLHLRDDPFLAETVRHSARYMGRAIIMPNLVPPVVTTKQAIAYRQRILAHLPTDSCFEPLMTLYLTDITSPEEISLASQSGHIHACKLYPAGATTNSEHGVTDVKNIYPALEKMSELHIPLLVHGEVTHADIDIFDREKVFIDKVLDKLVKDFPALKIVFEHITTRDAVDFVVAAGDHIGATITVQHLLYNRNNMLVGGIKPHTFCLPVLKRDIHQQALQEIVAAGNPKFFLGTDSAPHSRDSKENSCGCAGCFTSFAAIELYAEIFEQLDALDKLEAFASFNGPDFYGLPRNADTISLNRKEWQAPESYPFGDRDLVPLCAGQTIRWTVDD